MSRNDRDNDNEGKSGGMAGIFILVATFIFSPGMIIVGLVMMAMGYAEPRRIADGIHGYAWLFSICTCLGIIVLLRSVLSNIWQALTYYLVICCFCSAGILFSFFASGWNDFLRLFLGN